MGQHRTPVGDRRLRRADIREHVLLPSAGLGVAPAAIARTVWRERTGSITTKELDGPGTRWIASCCHGQRKGMGLAIAETLAAEGASVAVMARNRAALDAAVESLREAGAPEAVGISVDMADAASITAGFAAVSERWGQLNCLVHPVGPGDGYFEQMDDAEWDAAFALGTMSGVRSIRASLPLPPPGQASCVCPVRLAFSGRIRGSSPTASKAACPASPRTCRRALPRTASWSIVCVPAPS